MCMQGQGWRFNLIRIEEKKGTDENFGRSSVPDYFRGIQVDQILIVLPVFADLYAASVTAVAA